uniref:SLX9 ribosome biogenesis factor n=1 Tax=Salmo trutta TaxID=8032 RepID=A0A674F701_SALTR
IECVMYQCNIVDAHPLTLLSVCLSVHSPRGEEAADEEREDEGEISSIKLAKEQQVAQAKRAAMPVVGDMRPLADALPELCQLIPSTTKTSRKASRKNRVPVKKKPEPTDFSLMKPAQKRKLLESETSRFSEAVKNLAHSKTNPLAAIGEHLRKRLKQEEEQGPS